MNPILHATAPAAAGRTAPTARQGTAPAAQTVLQRPFAPRQLTLPLRPRG